jgi:DNA-binding NarL/FixJ family response regulator
MKVSYKVVVLDDHDLIAEAIKSMLLNNEIFQFINGFNNSKSLISFLESGNDVDFVLLDLHLNIEDGIAVCKQLTLNYPQINVIILSSITQHSLVTDALKNGAKGYLPKSVSYEELIKAFNSVLVGNIFIHQDISFVPIPKKQKSTQDYLPKFTRREKEILQLILDELTTQEIAEKLSISVSTVETHRSSLLLKVGAKNVVGLIKYTLEKGLLSST